MPSQSEGRPDLVPQLKALTLEELSEYCTRVLAEHAGIALQVEVRRCGARGCDTAIPVEAQANKRWCSGRCAAREATRRRRAAELAGEIREAA